MKAIDLQTEIMGTLSDVQAQMRAGKMCEAYKLINLAKVYILEADLTKHVDESELKKFQLTAKMFD